MDTDLGIENRHLRETVVSVRAALEKAIFEKDAAVQQAVQRSADEIQQLKDTATGLRDELINAKFTFEENLQKEALIKSDEHRHLQETIAKLRVKMEHNHAQ